MDSQNTRSPGFSASDSDPLDEFQTLPVSRLAILALVAGIASALALASEWFWFLPVVCIGLSALAGLSLRRSKTAMQGRSLIIAAVSLAVLFGAWAISARSVRQQRMIELATRFNQHWLQLVQTGHLKEAFQMTLEMPLRDDITLVSADNLANDPQVRARFHGFTKQAAVQVLVDAGGGAQIQLNRTEFHQAAGNLDVIWQSFRVIPVGGAPTNLIRIELERKLDSSSETALWTIRQAKQVIGSGNGTP